MSKLSLSREGKVQIKFCFVGNGAVGKTVMMIVSTKGTYPEVFVPTVFENYVGYYDPDGVQFEVALWDTTGQEDFDRLRPLSYPGTNVFCICFAISSRDSAEDVTEKWMHEIDHYNGDIKAAKFLIGLQKDSRYNPTTKEQLRYKGQKPVTTEEGEELARKIGAVKYLECSSLLNEGVKEVFTTILQSILEAIPEFKERYFGRQKERKSIRRVFSKAPTEI